MDDGHRSDSRLDALVDAIAGGMAVDWRALAARAHGRADLTRLGGLRFVAALRASASARVAPPSPPAWPRGVGPIVAVAGTIAAVQVVTIMAGVAAVLAGAVSPASPPVPALCLTLLFAAAAVTRPCPGDARRTAAFRVLSVVSAAAFARPLLPSVPPLWVAWTHPLFDGVVPIVITPACLWAMALGTPAAARFASFDVLARRAITGTTVVAVVVFLVNLGATPARALALDVAWLLRDDPSHAFWHVYTALAAVPVFVMAARAGCAPAAARRQAARLAVPLAVGASPFIAAGALRALVPAVETFFNTRTGAQGWLDTAILGSIALIPLAPVATVLFPTEKDTSERRDEPCRPPARVATDVLQTAASGRMAATVEAEDDPPAIECPRCGAVGPADTLPCGCGEPLVLAAVPCRLSPSLVITRRLGKGASAVVYAGCDVMLGRQVAFKAARARHAAASAALYTEARRMAALNHQGIATLYGVQVWRGRPILAMELCPRGTIEDRLVNGPMPVARALEVGRELAAALAYLHARGRIHGDVRPANIGISASGAARLLDFGASVPVTRASERTRLPAHRRVRHRGGAGTYLPPEARLLAAGSIARDLWAASMVMCEAMTGDTLPRSVGARSLPADVGALLARGLHVNPAKRFASARALGAALDVLLTARGIS